MGKTEVVEREVFELRTKKKVLEKENSRLFKENLKMDNDNGSLKRKNKSEADELSRLQTESQKVIRRMSAQKSVLGETKQKVDEAEGKLQGQWAEIDEAREENTKADIVLKKRETTLSQDKTKLADSNRVLAKSKEDHSVNVASFETEKGAFNIEKEEHKKVVTANEKTSDDIASSLEIIKNTETNQAAKAVQNTKDASTISTDRNALDRRESLLDAREKKLDVKEKSVEADKEEYARKSGGLDRRSNDIDVKAAEFKTTQLRVTKLIRDKGIKEELKRLEKSLKK